MKTVFLFAAGLLLSGSIAAVGQTHVPEVIVTFEFPDDSSKVTTLTNEEVRVLLNENFGYKVEWWVRGALVKLALPGVITVVDEKSKAQAVTSIAGIANDDEHSWVFYVNSIRSPYHINTQSREDVRTIRYVYERTSTP